MQTTAKKLPPGGLSVLPADTLQAFQFSGGDSAAADAQMIAVSGEPFHSAWRARTFKQPQEVYSVQLSARTAAPVKKGDALLATFWIRSIYSLAGSARTDFVFERAGDPYTKSVIFPVSATAQWRQIHVPFAAVEDYGVGAAQMNFHVDFVPQTIEIGGISVIDYGGGVRVSDLPITPFTYAGREPKAAWRADAQRRIEQFRMSDLTVTVTAAQGKPVPDAEVHLAMQRHAFGFGSAVAADGLLGTSADDRKYQETIVQLFNKVVLENDLKWEPWEQNRDRAIRGVQWLLDHHIAVRGHNLVWPGWNLLPARIAALKGDKEKLTATIDAHITDEVGALKDKIVEWDVVNEPVTNHQVMDVLGQDAMARWYRLAHEADPDAALFINDYNILAAGGEDANHQDGFEAIINYLLDNGAPLGGIGVQSHFDGRLTPPEKVLTLLDRFAKSGLPIEATEFDININDERLQADYLRDYMTILFSHPAVNGIIMWGFWEGRHWLPTAALYRRDWSLKPNGKAWLDLVRRQWWTDVTVKTDTGGKCRTRGFLGDYEVTVQSGSKTKTVPFTLSKENTTLTLILN
jgi:GH35 family endo-1,4-beta-xylanase